MSVNSKMTAIADAIRSITGGTETLTLDEMANAISESGGAVGILTVTAPVGVTVTATKDGKTYTKTANAQGIAVFKGLKTGTWAVTITDGNQTAGKDVEITADYSVMISFNAVPDFTYTGDFEIVNDADEPITESQDNWKIRFLTSGKLTFNSLNNAEDGIDVFLVGGGGGAGSGPYGHCAGGGGYTTTYENVELNNATQIDVVVGAGGQLNVNGGDSYFGSLKVSGGKHGSNGNGGAGGSGGGCYYTKGASNGGTAENQTHGTGTYYGGKGQGTTTREFGESTGKMYAGGGSCIDSSSSWPQAEGGGGAAVPGGNCNGTVNTGGGGGAAGQTYGLGGSGIVIIRNARKVVA